MADPAPALMLPVAIVQHLGQLAWPVAVLIVVYRFRHPIESLLSRLASLLKLEEVSGVSRTCGQASDHHYQGAASIPGPDGFLTVGVYERSSVSRDLCMATRM
jgi:hypothetical protein